MHRQIKTCLLLVVGLFATASAAAGVTGSSSQQADVAQRVNYVLAGATYKEQYRRANQLQDYVYNKKAVNLSDDDMSQIARLLDSKYPIVAYSGAGSLGFFGPRAKRFGPKIQ